MTAVPRCDGGEIEKKPGCLGVATGLGLGNAISRALKWWYYLGVVDVTMQ